MSKSGQKWGKRGKRGLPKPLFPRFAHFWPLLDIWARGDREARKMDKILKNGQSRQKID